MTGYKTESMNPDELNALCKDKLPGHLGIKTTSVSGDEVHSEMHVKEIHLAPNGYLHAGAITTLADTTCGNGCLASLPEGATGFTTIELKSNHIGTERDGTVDCVATPVHAGKTTQVWDATVTSRSSGRTIALFRCTQMILYPK